MSRAPYKYLDYYEYEDQDLFFGREEEVQRMVGEILTSRLLVLFSPSGSGKTSLINAGVRPALAALDYETVYVRLDKEPVPSVIEAVTAALDMPENGKQPDVYQFVDWLMFPKGRKNDGVPPARKPLVVFVDQFEEFFIIFRQQPELRHAFIRQLAQIKYDQQLPVFLVLSLREDYFVDLHEFREDIPSIFQNNANIRLKPFSDAEAQRAIELPAKAVGLQYEANLVPEIIADLKEQAESKQGVEPITLQIVCHTLWQEQAEDSKEISQKTYEDLGRAERIIANTLSCALNEIPRRLHGLMTRTFEALKTPDNTKRYRSLPDLQEGLKVKDETRFQRLLSRLTELDILRHEQRQELDWYEFKHDYLVGEITQWIYDRRERLSKKRTHNFLIFAILMAVIAVASLVNYEFNARDQLHRAIQIMKPANNQVLIGDFRDERSMELPVVLEKDSRLVGANVLVNNARMAIEDYRVVVPFSPDIPADSSEISLEITVDKGLREVTRHFSLDLIRLRIIPDENLSHSAVNSMIGRFDYYDRDKNPSSTGLVNNFVAHRDSLVFDRATGLIWQQSGSSQMVFSEAQAYVDSLNRTEYGGYSDWRLPTLEEAMTLMEPEENNGDLYIDPIFGQTQRWIWTSDKRIASYAWVVDFGDGGCGSYRVHSSFVRAVR